MVNIKSAVTGVKLTKLLIFLLLFSCATPSQEGKCLKWKTIIQERQECTRQPYRVCIVVPVQKTVCVDRETN